MQDMALDNRHSDDMSEGKDMNDSDEIDEVWIHPDYIKVAVALLHYQDRYLLGYRHANQHQGDCYEFIGGKVAGDESVYAALCREVREEVGMDISHNRHCKMGRIYHDYADRQVCLIVHDVCLTELQYAGFSSATHGREGQRLCWVSKAELQAGRYPLPAANAVILDWLCLPDLFAITQPLQLSVKSCRQNVADAIHTAANTPETTTHNTAGQVSYDATDDSSQSITQNNRQITYWLSEHRQHLPKHTGCYVRVHSGCEMIDSQVAAALLQQRPDVISILPYAVLQRLSDSDKMKVWGQQLRHDQLLAMVGTQASTGVSDNIYGDMNGRVTSGSSDCRLLDSHPIIISCHDQHSIEAANLLAGSRHQAGLSEVLAVFISPVQATTSHQDVAPLGWDRFARLAALSDVPVIALGGLSPEDTQRAYEHGAMAVAGIRHFYSHLPQDAVYRDEAQDDDNP